MAATTVKQNLMLMRPGFEDALRQELAERFGIQGEVSCRAGVAFPETNKWPEVGKTVFARQVLPRALRFKGEDIAACVKFVTDRIDVMTRRDNRQTGAWTLHAFAIDDDDNLAKARAIAKQVQSHLRQHQADFLKRFISPEDFASSPRGARDLIIQIYTPAKDDLWLSIATLADGLSPWEGGFQRMKTLRGAPSRSASKLEEALSTLGKHPTSGETAVDLGAAPGGWSFVLARHGATVTAVDHAELDIKDQSIKKRITHTKENGLKYLPPKPVDWMVCDMVIPAKETLKVLHTWRAHNSTRNFIVNLKLGKSDPWPQVKEALAVLEAIGWPTLKARHLFHDRSEITLMGSQADSE